MHSCTLQQKICANAALNYSGTGVAQQINCRALPKRPPPPPPILAL